MMDVIELKEEEDNYDFHVHKKHGKEGLGEGNKGEGSFLYIYETLTRAQYKKNLCLVNFS